MTALAPEEHWIRAQVTTAKRSTSLSGEERELTKEVAGVEKEFRTNPERASVALESLDVDAQLMRNVLASRRGIRGVFNRLAESGLTRFLGSSVAGVALGTASRRLLHASNPLAGAMTGGAIGGFWGWMRGRNRAESASNWMNQLNMPSNTKELAKRSDEELEMMLGIMKQAIENGKVRGNSATKLEMARNYRAVKNTLIKRRTESSADKTKNSAVLERLNSAIGSETDVGKIISGSCGEQYKELYEQVLKGNRKQIWGSALKGAAVGAGLGALGGYLFDKVFHGAGAAGSENDNGQNILAAKQASLQEQHQRVMDVYNNQDFSSNAELQQYLPQIEHLNNLSSINGAESLQGFDANQLQNFNAMLSANDSIHNLVQQAGLHNIDLGARVGETGQNLASFLVQNKDAYMHLTPEIQRQILSYPSLAQEILNSTTNTGSLATSSIIGMTTAIGGAAGVAVMGGAGLYYGSKGKTENQVAWSGAREGIKEERTSFAKAAKEKVKQNIEASKQGLIGSELYFLDVSKLDAGYPKQTTNRKFKVVDIDADGKLQFELTTNDEAELRKPANKRKQFHPDVNIKDIVDSDGKLDDTKLAIVSTASAEATSTGAGGEKSFDEIKTELTGKRLNVLVLDANRLQLPDYDEPIAYEIGKSKQSLPYPTARIIVNGVKEEGGAPKLTVDFYEDVEGTTYLYQNSIRQDEANFVASIGATGVLVKNAGTLYIAENKTGADVSLRPILAGAGTVTNITLNMAHLKDPAFMWFKEKV